MSKKSKKYLEAVAKVPEEPIAPLAAMGLVKEISTANFDETVTADFRLGIDTRQAGHSHARWVHRQASLATSLPYYNKAARLVPKVPSLPCPLGRLIALGASRPKTLVKGVGPPDDDEKRHAKPLQHPTDRARTARSTAAAPR